MSPPLTPPTTAPPTAPPTAPDAFAAAVGRELAWIPPVARGLAWIAAARGVSPLLGFVVSGAMLVWAGEPANVEGWQRTGQVVSWVAIAAAPVGLALLAWGVVLVGRGLAATPDRPPLAEIGPPAVLALVVVLGAFVPVAWLVGLGHLVTTLGRWLLLLPLLVALGMGSAALARARAAGFVLGARALMVLLVLHAAVDAAFVLAGLIGAAAPGLLGPAAGVLASSGFVLQVAVAAWFGLAAWGLRGA